MREVRVLGSTHRDVRSSGRHRHDVGERTRGGIVVVVAGLKPTRRRESSGDCGVRRSARHDGPARRPTPSAGRDRRGSSGTDRTPDVSSRGAPGARPRDREPLRAGSSRRGYRGGPADPAGSFAADGARVPLGRRAGAARAQRRDLGGRARPRVARADRAARSDPQLLRHRRRRPGARDRPARRLDADRGSVSRRPDRREGPRPDRRDPHDLLLARLRELRPGLRQRGRPSNPRGRLRHRRQDEHTGVRHRRVHGVGAQRRDPEPVEHRRSRRAARAEGPLRPSRPGSSPPRTQPMAAAPFASRRRAAGCSGSSPRGAASPARRTGPSRVSRRRGRSPAPSRTPRTCWTYSPGTSRAIRGGRRLRTSRSRPRRTILHLVCAWP